MSLPGWYPDPAGGSEKYRFFDGQSWSSATTNDPNDEPPDEYGFAGGGVNWGLIAVIIAVIVAIGLVLWLIFGATNTHIGERPPAPVPEDTNSAAPTVSGWDESSTPTPPPTQASLQDCPTTTNTDQTPQQKDGRLRGGGISVEKVPEWNNSGNMYLQWVSDLHSQDEMVRPGWMSNVMVGQLNAEDGFDNMQVAARQTMECLASSGYYLNFTERIDLRDESYQVGSFDAWRMTAEVRIDSELMPEIEGDVVDIVVVDTGDPQRLGLFISCITIGDDARAQQAEQALSTLRVER